MAVLRICFAWDTEVGTADVLCTVLYWQSTLNGTNWRRSWINTATCYMWFLVPLVECMWLWGCHPGASDVCQYVFAHWICFLIMTFLRAFLKIVHPNPSLFSLPIHQKSIQWLIVMEDNNRGLQSKDKSLSAHTVGSVSCKLVKLNISLPGVLGQKHSGTHSSLFVFSGCIKQGEWERHGSLLMNVGDKHNACSRS